MNCLFTAFFSAEKLIAHETAIYGDTPTQSFKGDRKEKLEIYLIDQHLTTSCYYESKKRSNCFVDSRF
jgi:hypothetical protein